jgi:hypothetical protein
MFSMIWFSFPGNAPGAFARPERMSIAVSLVEEIVFG